MRKINKTVLGAVIRRLCQDNTRVQPGRSIDDDGVGFTDVETTTENIGNQINKRSIVTIKYLNKDAASKLIAITWPQLPSKMEWKKNYCALISTLFVEKFAVTFPRSGLPAHADIK